MNRRVFCGGVLVGTSGEVLANASASGGSEEVVEEPPPQNVFDLDLDQDAAVGVAEAVLVHRFGRQVLGQRPWKVRREGPAFVIDGTLKTTKGGVASITIRRANAEVIRVSHGK